MVPHNELEDVALEWAAEVNSKESDGAAHAQVRLQHDRRRLGRPATLRGEATRLGYATEEAQEGRDAFVDKRPRDFSRFPWHY